MPPEIFDDMDGYLPPYVPPEPTGDELLDMMLELQAYRAWQEKIRTMRSDISGITTHQLTQQISRDIDKMIIDDLVKLAKEAVGETDEEKTQNFYDSFSELYEISEENRNNGLDLPDI